MVSHITPALVAIISLLHLQPVQARWPEKGAYANPNTGIWGVSPSNLTEYFKSPNATGTYNFIGRDIAVPYEAPKLKDMPGYSWQASVVADVPLTESESIKTTPEERINGSFTAAAVTLQIPAERPPHESWLLCVLSWQSNSGVYKSSDVTKEEAKEDKDKFPEGSCAPFFGEKCVNDIQDSITDDHATLSKWCSCPSSTSTKSCGDRLSAGRWASRCVATLYNSSQIRDWPDGKLNIIQYGSEKGGMGNRTRYDEIGGSIWPVALVWGDSGKGYPKGALYMINRTASMSCVRAVNATEGSVAPSLGHREGLSTMLMSTGLMLAVWMALL
ncbi:hypothetical protein QBC43DRAFT_296144 [Cladorrhinum sp. PSN259]|nr:hypothetical protein QBC43DRAFT_296144 [Cladorrhinum sp. PSN259]